MDTKRTLLSCPGRVQDWLGAATEQIETLLQVPLPSLSGSDQAIGALRIEREKPAWKTCPYNLRSSDVVSAALPMDHQMSLSVSSGGEPLCPEKSPSRCENCVAKKGSRCSRDLPSCTRCHKSGMFCFYTEGVATCRRKLEGRRERSCTKEGEPDLPAEVLLVTPVPEDPALPKTDESSAARYSSPETSSLYPVSEYVQRSLEHSTIYPFPAAVLPSEYPTDPLCQTVATNRQITGAPSFDVLPRRTNKLDATLEITGAELHPEFPDEAANGLKPSFVASTATEEINCQDSNWGEKRKLLENVLQKCVDDEAHAAHPAVLPLQVQPPSHRQTSAVSSLAATPLASTLGSRSTSQSSETGSLPITPATELPTPLNTQQISATEDAGAQMEERVDLYLLSHHQHQTACDAASSTDPQDKSLSDGFLEELFEEGDAARKLVELQQRSTEGKFSLGP